MHEGELRGLLSPFKRGVAPISDYTGKWAAPSSFSVGFFPAFDGPAFARDALWRAAWSLSPLNDRITKVAVAGVTDPAALLQTRPDYFSAATARAAEQLSPKLSVASGSKALDCDIVLVWRFDSALDRRLRGRRAYLVDDACFEHSADRWARISSDASPSLSAMSLAHLAQFDSVSCGRRAVILGTGPTLDGGLDRGVLRPDDDVFLCNSAVRRPDLFRRFRVRAIGLGDPVFHSGPSRMAGALRRDLLRRLRESADTYLICPDRDAPLYMEEPGFPTERLIALSSDDRLPIKTSDIRRDCVTPASANVITLTLLPLVVGRYAEIAFLGCDGQAPGEAGYFWSHSNTAQYTDQFDSAYLAHPAFFRRNFEAYSAAHERALAVWIEHAEAQGSKVTSLTPSHILPLSQRFE